MDSERQAIDVHGVDHDGVRGVWVRGEAPKELVLSDGSRLRLEPAEQGRVEWHRCDGLEERDEPLTLPDAERLAGDFASYVQVRTRAESEWLRAVSDWCTIEADRLDGELAHADR